MTNGVSVTLSRAVGRGLSCNCPRCGQGNIFARYLKPAATCSSCGEPYGEIRTDDIAPYFTILVVGHLIVPLVLMVEKLYAPEVWIHWMLWPPLTLFCTFIALPRIKGAVIGWMWWLGMRGDEQH